MSKKLTKIPQLLLAELSDREQMLWQLLWEREEFKGYQDYTVQELMIKAHNVRYRLAIWKTPTGKNVRGELEPKVREQGHFGPTLKTYILYQNYHCHVTQPLLLEQLREWGIDISSGQSFFF